MPKEGKVKHEKHAHSKDSADGFVFPKAEHNNASSDGEVESHSTDLSGFIVSDGHVLTEGSSSNSAPRRKKMKKLVKRPKIYKMNFCSKCRENLKFGDHFCYLCGYNVFQSEQENYGTQRKRAIMSSSSSNSDNEHPGPSKKKRMESEPVPAQED